MKNRLLVAGSIGYDQLETPFGKVKKTLGGCTSHIALATKFFAMPSVIAVAGTDFEKKDISMLEKNGVDLSGLEIKPGKTFAWGGKYSWDLNSRETLFTHLGVFENFQPKLLPHHQNLEYIMLGNIHPKLQLDVLQQVKSPKFVALDTMNFWIAKAKPELLEILKKVNVFIINDSEARELSGENNILKSAKKILEKMHNSHPTSLKHYIPKTLIIKRGEYGLLMFQNLSLRVHPKQSIKRLPRSDAFARNDIVVFHLPGLPLENVIDPTGAGDSFAGGFMGYLAKTRKTNWENLKTACVYGSAMASFCVENFGTKKLQALKQSEIEKRVEEFKKLSHF